jgi:hypothetical protein
MVFVLILGSYPGFFIFDGLVLAFLVLSADLISYQLTTDIS